MSATIDTWLAAATCLFARTAYRAPKQVGFQHVCALLVVESRLLSRLWPNLVRARQQGKVEVARKVARDAHNTDASPAMTVPMLLLLSSSCALLVGLPIVNGWAPLESNCVSVVHQHSVVYQHGVSA
jgi:hypothetical protein